DDKGSRAVRATNPFEETEEERPSPEAAVLQPMNEAQEMVFSVNVGALGHHASERLADRLAQDRGPDHRVGYGEDDAQSQIKRVGQVAGLRRGLLVLQDLDEPVGQA